MADQFFHLFGGGVRQVTYFKQKRVMEYKKAQTMEQLAQEGATGIPRDDRRPPP